jgi:hypothetical protein
MILLKWVVPPLLMVLPGLALCDQVLPSVSIAYAGWNFVPHSKYSIDYIRKHPTYRVESDDYSFYEFVLETLNEPAMQKCNATLDKSLQIRMVIDIFEGGKHRSFISDGLRLFTSDQARCRTIDEAFKSKFLITAFDQ